MDTLNPTPTTSSVFPVNLRESERELLRCNPFLIPRPTDEAVKNSTILVVDDEESITLTVCKYLKLAGFTKVFQVNDSTKAIQKIESVRPDLILLDLMMPVSGFQILESMYKRRHLQNMPVVTLTSNTDTETKIKVLNLGANDFLTKPVNVTELVARVRNTLSEKVLRDQLAHHTAQLETSLLLDELTGVANRRAFDFELTRRFIEWTEQRIPVSLLMVDIDFFKNLNDKHGHQLGDLALEKIGQHIKGVMRDVDLTARYGGEEFAVIMPNTKPVEASAVAERLRKSIEKLEICVENENLRLTVSIGVSSIMNGDETDTIIRRADMALYSAKHNGRNQSFIHDGDNCVQLTKVAEKKPTVNADTTVKSMPEIRQSKILIVDDEPAIIFMARRMLRNAGYENVATETDSRKVLSLVSSTQPDLVLLDIRMPHMDGMEVLQNIRRERKTEYTPVVFLTSDSDTETRVQALHLGANDFLTKPVNESELIARVKNTLLAKAHTDTLEHYSAQLEQQVQMRTAELMTSRREALQALARAAEIRDDQTGKHVFRVGKYSAIIASRFGFTPENIVWFEHAAQLHDVGKIGIPDEILNKPGGLTDKEFDIIRTHCQIGSGIIRNDADAEIVRSHTNWGARIFEDCTSPLMRMAAMVADTHHEKWDGSGYPHGLKGEDIPIEGRIVAVADVFDALSSKRPYKDAFSIEKCLQIISESSGSHFDPKVVEAFIDSIDEILEVYRENNDAAKLQVDLARKQVAADSE